MPFEPIRTDEKLTEKSVRESDLDTQMLAGCSTFVALSLLTYLMVVWPHLVFFEGHRLNVLLLDLGLGMVPALVIGAMATRRLGLPAAGGFLSGALAAAIFLLLRLKQVLLLEGVKDLPNPEFPASWQYLVPIGWIIAVAMAIAVTLKREEIVLR